MKCVSLNCHIDSGKYILCFYHRNAVEVERQDAIVSNARLLERVVHHNAKLQDALVGALNALVIVKQERDDLRSRIEALVSVSE